MGSSTQKLMWTLQKWLWIHCLADGLKNSASAFMHHEWTVFIIKHQFKPYWLIMMLTVVHYLCLGGLQVGFQCVSNYAETWKVEGEHAKTPVCFFKLSLAYPFMFNCHWQVNIWYRSGALFPFREGLRTCGKRCHLHNHGTFQPKHCQILFAIVYSYIRQLECFS